MKRLLISFLIGLDERYLARHPNGDGPVLRRVNAWINRRFS